MNNDNKINRNRICFLIADISGKGGTERVTSFIANGLISMNYDITIISINHGCTPTYPIDKEIKIHILNNIRSKNIIYRKCETLYRLSDYLQSENFDVVIVVDSYIYLYLYIIKHKIHSRVIVWDHFNYYVSKTPGTRLARRLAAQYADRLIVLGENDCITYKKKYRDARKIDFIYNPITISADSYCIEPSLKNNKRIIAVGRLERQKGFDLLLKSWAIVEKINQEGLDWHLDIFGDGPDREYLSEYIENNKLKNVHLKGYSKDITSEYLNSSMYLLSSRYEGFALSLLEALSFCLPCICFKCHEGPEEVIENGVNGYLVEEGDINSFAKYINQLIQDRELLNEMSGRTRTSLSRFAPSSVITKWDQLIQSLLERDAK